jgi:bacteriocin biosynthesis cyclodehydratase domain-containing protein
VTACYGMRTEPSPPVAALARPTLLPGLRRLWRSPRSLQLGVDPARAVVLDLPTPGTARVLDLLDGTRSQRQVIDDARRHGIGEADARTLIEHLHTAGLVLGAHALLPRTFPEPMRRRLAAEAAALALRGTGAPATPAQILRRRATARIVVTGGGLLARTAAVALARAGIGHVAPTFDRPEEGREVATAIRGEAPGTRTSPLPRLDATFVVHGGGTGPASLAAARYARLAHLSVIVRDGTAVIGPLVPPRGSPCLNCLDLHRQDRDPDWRGLAPQLQARPDLEPCTAATALTAAGLATGEVLSWLDGTAATTLGGCLEVTDGGRIRRRRWPPHPRCHCLRRGRRRAPAAGREPGAAVGNAT